MTRPKAGQTQVEISTKPSMSHAFSMAPRAIPGIEESLGGLFGQDHCLGTTRDIASQTDLMGEFDSGS
jgi:hypothetical protein